MFSAPLRLVGTLRPNVPLGVIAATAVSTVVFASTPFLIPAVAADYDVDVSTVGLMSTAQLLGFVLASSIGPRAFNPRRTVMTAAVVLGIIANLASAIAPTFAVLLGTRFVSGVSLGLIAWIAWAEVFGDDERVGDVAVIAPIIGIVASPIIALVLDQSSPSVWFVALALLHLIPAVTIRSMRLQAAVVDRQRRHRPTKAAAAILLALGLLTCGGSSIFIYAADIGSRDAGLGAVAVSLAYSLNSAASVPSARWRGRRGAPWIWLAVTAACALTLGVVPTAIGFFGALVVWGFSFWMGIPGAFSILASRSAYPSERAGDAQAVMAAGRVVGPLLGSALYATGTANLAIVAAAIMALAAAILAMIEWRVRPRRGVLHTG